jgi:hypothetical protein
VVRRSYSLTCHEDLIEVETAPLETLDGNWDTEEMLGTEGLVIRATDDAQPYLKHINLFAHFSEKE